MKFVRSRYPVFPGCTGDPCWTLTAKYLWIDIDWNPRFPFGACAGFYFGPEHDSHLRSGGFTLDLNARPSVNRTGCTCTPAAGM